MGERKLSTYTLCILLSFGILAVDLFVPLGVAEGVAYVAVVLISLWTPGRRFPVFVSALATVFIVIGFLFSPEGGVGWMVVANRALSVMVVWVAAVLGLSRISAEERLKASEEKFRTLLQAAPIGIGLTAPYGTVIEANSAMLRMLGFEKKEELLATNASIHYDEAGGRKRFSERLKRDGAVRDYEVSLRRRDGTVFTALLNSVAIRGEGEEDLIISTIQDVTERRRLEEELQKGYRLESIGRLAGGIAHNFNNLLTVIMGNTSLALEYTREDRRLTRLLEKVDMASSQARLLTQKLITFSEGGAPVKKVQGIDAVVRDAASLVLSGSSTALDLEMPEDLWEADFDEGQIAHVMQNLVQNADQAMPEGGVVTIRGRNIEGGLNPPEVDLEGRLIEITVADSGVGIAPEVIGRVFEPYYSTKAEGRGLGLALSYSIIKKHGGAMTVESTPGDGTAFHAYLPAAADDRVPA